MWKLTCSYFFYCLFVLMPDFATAQVKDQPIELQSVFINVKASLFTATTLLEMEFYNPNSKALDGEYNFSLSPGQVITGFALDINGFMRQGVIVDKQKGRVAYENTIRRRVDPGLLEMTNGNNYRVRIYPVPAMGTRKIKIVIAEELSIDDNSLHYHLPLDIPYLVKQLEVSVSAVALQEAPFTEEGLLKGIEFKKDQDSFLVAYNRKNIELRKPLSFRIPLTYINKIVCAGRIGKSIRFALHIKPEMIAAPADPVATATVFWDISGSSSKRDTRKDLLFLETFIKEKNITDLTVLPFSNTVHGSIAFHGKSIFNAVRRYLQEQIPDGGTQLGSLDCNKFNSDVFLLFSDGVNNFGSDKIKTNDKVIHCINSSPAANHAGLKRIAEKTGGRYVDLYATGVDNAIKEFKSAKNYLLQVQAGDKNVICNSSLPFLFDQWVTITGEINSAGKLLLSFGDAGRITKTEQVVIDTTGNCPILELAELCILQQFQKLTREEDEQALALFAKQNKLVTASTSFIVLDNLQDYIQYGIEPPADLQEEYNKVNYIVKQREEQLKVDEANAVVNKLRKSVDLYNERIKWWSKEEPLISLKVIDKKPEERIVSAADDKAIATNEQNTSNPATGNFKAGSASLQEVVVVGYGSQRRMSLTSSITTVRGSDISGALSVQQALAGRVAGLTVVDNGAPGAASKIFIRGANTLGQNAEPLYVLDGVQVNGDIAAMVNVSDIESITVLKDVQAGVLYGSRAVNGAIVITTKRGAGNTSRYRREVERYKDMEDIEYVTGLKDGNKKEMYERYLQMKDSLGREPAFYFDAAEVMFASGNKEKALQILSNLAEMDNENHQLLRALGYMLETWALYDEAVDVYKKVLLIKEEEPQSYRDLALVYEKKGDHQQAVDILYQALSKNWFVYEDRYRGLKSLLLNEMNSIIHLNRKTLDLSKINPSVIKPLPVDIRIVIDWNKDETDIDLHIVEPGGEECYYSHRLTKQGGRLSEDFTQGYGPEEYQVKAAKKGRYAIRVNYYGDRYQKEQVPSFVKLTIYKNFGKPNQSVSTQSLIMDYQQGTIEIGEIKW
jgi:TonB-dependent SusC/RagA subfamily outer membrane receptor